MGAMGCRRAASVKRLFDIVVAGSSLILLAPFLALIWLLVRARLGSPAFFGQTRPGLKARPFRMVKFRTMLDLRDADGQPMPDSVRLTSFGARLRSTSLDELPELWNVLRGEMSLVGPRPLLMDYLPLYTPEQARRHEVRPGITGWAQINGRNMLSWEEKFALDIWYVDNHTMWLDLQILLLTVAKAIRRDDISATGEATAPRFTGIDGLTGDAEQQGPKRRQDDK
jgi:lipopolysaccharide/colanic/teichoic acid biosynthesis glycosyltransferase